ncbi:MAG: hypothetical protein IPM14_13125 [bacterium]|nr:hypothetical protein [bacterium]
MSDAIATYSERRFDGRREFTLFADKVAISGTTSLGPRFEMTVQLNSLVPVADRLWARSRGFWQGIVLAVVSAILALGFTEVLPQFWMGLLWVVAVGGVLLAAVTFRRVEWASFNNSAGTPVLTIAKVGPKREEFDRFVSAIVGAIRAAGPGKGGGAGAA